jgi:excisionase family DNA binding protein
MHWSSAPTALAAKGSPTILGLCRLPIVWHMRYTCMFDTNTKKPSRGPAASASISGIDLPAWVYTKPEPLATPQAPADATDDLLTRAEVARYLRVSDRTVSRLIRKGQLPAARIGRAVRIRQSDLLEMLNEKPSISASVGACRE